MIAEANSQVNGIVLIPMAIALGGLLVWTLRTIYESSDYGRTRYRDETPEQATRRRLLAELRTIERDRPDHIIRSDNDEWSYHHDQTRGQPPRAD